MIYDLLIATSNPGKFYEITNFLSGLPCRFRSVHDVKISTDFIEDGDSFKTIACQKAIHFARLSDLPTLAEDSGIFVDALPGQLGMHTRRFGQKHGGSTDEEWIAHFLHCMQDVPPQKRTAEFFCAVCVFWDGVPYFFEGKTRGVITQNLAAPIHKGLPLSSCFMPEGSTKVYAALSKEEKATVSHRGKALAKARAFLMEVL